MSKTSKQMKASVLSSKVSIPVVSIPGYDTTPKPITSKLPVVTDDPKDVKILPVQPIEDVYKPKKEIIPEPKKPSLLDVIKDPKSAVDETKKGSGGGGGGGIFGGLGPIVDVVTIPLGPIGKVVRPIGESASGAVNGIGDVAGGVGNVIGDVAGGVGNVAGRLLDIGDNFLDFLSNPLLTIGVIVVGGIVVTRLIK